MGDGRWTIGGSDRGADPVLHGSVTCCLQASPTRSVGAKGLSVRRTREYMPEKSRFRPGAAALRSKLSVDGVDIVPAVVVLVGGLRPSRRAGENSATSLA
jgi:hypothetical protein